MREKARNDRSSLNLNLDLNLVLQRCRISPRNILQSLLAVQAYLGCVPTEVVPEIARALQVTEADVAGVLSFYPDLHLRQAGRHRVRVCVGESCVANHGSRVLTALAEELRIGLGATTPDKRFTLERVYCVGNCAVSPTVVIDEHVHGRVMPSDIPALLAPYK
ncbi:MAG: NAD(P)H-dependent oxidoreductase subunit E [Nitrospirae bacterium]|nr:NAD(P)H-dependent oxidoreductase subunit E [Nitrospirota bacterium]